jgi:hypothetical protein
VSVKIAGANREAESAQLVNHVAAASARLKDRSFDGNRSAERRHDPIGVDGEISLAIDASETGRRNVAAIGEVHRGSASVGWRGWRKWVCFQPFARKSF